MIVSSISTVPGSPTQLLSGTAGAAMDALDEAVCACLVVPYTGSITHVIAVVSQMSVAGTPGPTVALETIDTAGLPTGSAYGGSVGSVVALTGTALKAVRVALATPADATAGDLIAVTFRNPSSGTTPVWSLRAGATSVLPYVATYMSGAWSKSNNPPALALEYAGEKVVACVSAVCNSATNFFGSSGSVVGYLITLPLRVRARGIVGVFDADYPCVMRLRNRANRVLFEGVLAGGAYRGVTYSHGVQLNFVPQWLDAGQYYLLIEESTGGNNALQGHAFESFLDTEEKRLAAVPMAIFPVVTGTWPYTVSTTHYGGQLGILYDQIEVPTRLRTRPLKGL